MDRCDDGDSGPGADVARYEQLRAQALSGDPGGWRCGLAILQHRGLVSWLHAWRAVPASDQPARPVPASGTVAPPAGVADRLVQALASLALAVAAGE